ncbi:hypothetical protein M406DRAFT_49512 [Cryphonectria parasitica EP155]|uniref:RBR-type E3 ubiquitin transferase n=1 Tax=Cryphonectria parasitica (strain ATCC 38755 / EP155) TaxID=660469 RepID=A0A9P5CMN6_CRYP1|nr:uncharacterized protein M406DRAFT_49512 [Cryphonectria parasitica EP155]KAF3763266.1 hypothetical protein M406DRAFT_49512 [Cryphonectria parasitica EP155]
MDIDDKTAIIILRLQAEDLEEFSRHRAANAKGKERHDHIDDLGVALELHKAEIQSRITFLSDRQMTLSLARANREDGGLISNLTAQDVQIARDWRLACKLANKKTALMQGPGPDKAARLKKQPDTVDDELLKKLDEMYVSGPQAVLDNDHQQAELSSWAASRKVSTAKPELLPCNTCLDRFPISDITRAPCSHHYCRGCLVEHFTRSLKDESLFPPRCCGQPIPPQSNRRFLSSQLIESYEAKKLEQETIDATYCHRPSCGAFIPPRSVSSGVGTCVKCKTTTCASCKKAPHVGECPEDPATQEILRMAKENGWQSCYSCHRLVELRHGCNHITCRCGAQFCYVCAARWKKCTCAQWDEDRLFDRANVVADREVRNRTLPAAARSDMVAQVRQQLINDHECAHNSWRRIDGPRECEECGDKMPIWLNVCRRCNIMVCRRCRFNRV